MVRGRRWLPVLLVVLTALPYAQTLRFGFVPFDDDRFITENPYVREGVTLRGVRWAVGAVGSADHKIDQPHPLTWLSHMLTCQFFGLNAAAHHGVNLLLHVLCVLAAWVLLRRLGLATWAAFTAGAVFALHPVQVESVAWVSERKNLLAGLFMLLSMAAYLDHARRGGWGRYVLWMGLAVAALLSKPVAVVLPGLLLLLDYWPLQRGRLVRRTIEKWPLLLLVVLLAAWTLAAQHEVGATAQGTNWPMTVRLAHMPVALAGYLQMVVWPARLAIQHPHPGMPAAWQLAGTLVLLVGITALTRRWRPIAWWGWLFFLLPLTPVLGIIQAGSQGWADRYLYLPILGLAVGVVGPCRRPGRVHAMVTAVLIVTMSTLTWRQAATWRDAETLWRRAYSVHPHDPGIQYGLALALLDRGQNDEAEHLLRLSCQGNPEGDFNHYWLGRVLLGRAPGEAGEAAAYLSQAVQRKPALADAWRALAQAQEQLGDPAAALASLDQAAQRQPGDAGVQWERSKLLSRLGRGDDAAAARQRAVLLLKHNIEREPAADDLYLLALIVGSAGDHAAAAASCQRALTLMPDHIRTRDLLATSLARLGKYQEAERQWKQCIERSPRYWPALANLGQFYLTQQRPADAAEMFRRALMIVPGNLQLSQRLALAAQQMQSPEAASPP